MIVPGRFVLAELWRGEPPDHPSCSRNAHDQNVLVRRAQGRTVRRLPLGRFSNATELRSGGFVSWFGLD